jgi:potassium efflux system protein
VLTGALGVGVGFGLQNIVNNFVSGLILQFERPIHIGDVLDIDGTTGKVTRIGIRSSTVKTFQGAEVIIPNANFISSKVINWTLSESLRRVELPVGVAYGTDPKLVTRLLEQAATAHESVLTSPAPMVLFKDFAESSLSFELQFWVMQESNGTKVKSEVGLAIMQLLDHAGIEIPFPQRDLRLRSVDPTAAATLIAPDSAESKAAGTNGDQPEASLLTAEADRKTAGKS